MFLNVRVISITKFLLKDDDIFWNKPNYKVLYGWCPERKFFMQHATARQLLETKLITEEQWNTYFKFSFVRNPWDRAISDYYWLQKDQNIRGSFKQYLFKEGVFKKIFKRYRNYALSWRPSVRTDFFF